MGMNEAGSTAMRSKYFLKLKRFIHRDIVGYFAPVIALIRLRKKHSLNYVHQLRVIYRYTFGKH